MGQTFSSVVHFIHVFVRMGEQLIYCKVGSYIKMLL